MRSQIRKQRVALWPGFLRDFEGHGEAEDFVGLPTFGTVYGLDHVVGPDGVPGLDGEACADLEAILREDAAGREAVGSGDEEELVVEDEHGAEGGAKRKSVVDARAKSEACGGRAALRVAAFDECAEVGAERALRFAERDVEDEAVFVFDVGVAGKALIAVVGRDGEDGQEAEGHTGLDEVLEEVSGVFVEAFVELGFERFVRRERVGDSLVEPDAELLFVFGIFRRLCLLRASGEGECKAEGCYRERDESSARE